MVLCWWGGVVLLVGVWVWGCWGLWFVVGWWVGVVVLWVCGVGVGGSGGDLWVWLSWVVGVFWWLLVGWCLFWGWGGGGFVLCWLGCVGLCVLVVCGVGWRVVLSWFWGWGGGWLWGSVGFGGVVGGSILLLCGGGVWWGGLGCMDVGGVLVVVVWLGGGWSGCGLGWGMVGFVCMGFLVVLGCRLLGVGVVVGCRDGGFVL